MDQGNTIQEFNFKIQNNQENIETYASSLRIKPNDYCFTGFYRENDLLTLYFKLSEGLTNVIFNGNKITFNVIIDPNIKALAEETTKHRELYMKIYAENEDIAISIFKQFLLAANEYCKGKKEDCIRVNVYKQNVGWMFLSDLPKRSLDTIYIDEAEKTKIIDDVAKFYESQSLYRKFGIPYKRIYLFEGMPGLGKTSLIFSIASKFNKNINFISFSQCMDDASFMKTVNSIQADTILVLEDVDALFTGRTSKSGITFSGLLNCLDGFGRKDKLLIFMTTNYINDLDNALKRPGRVDVILSFSYPKKNQIKKMFDTFFPDQSNNFDQIYDVISRKKASIALLQKFFFDNLSCSNITDKIPELEKLIEFYSKEESKMYN